MKTQKIKKTLTAIDFSQPDNPQGASLKDVYETVRLLQMEIKAIGQRNQQDFQAIAGRLAQLLPRQEDERQQRINKFTKQDFKDYLNGKIKL
jgi:FtsZ-binding cell division protein ZapB